CELDDALLECVDGRGTLARLEQRRQFSQRAQPEIVEKLARGAEQLGPPEYVLVPDGLDPPALLERAHQMPGDGHAADLLDVSARYRLPVRDDRERFEQGSGIPRRLLGVQAPEVVRHLRRALEPPAGCERAQFDTASVPLLAQF